MNTNTASRAQSKGVIKPVPLGIVVPVLLTLYAIVLWGLSLQQVNISQMNDFGLMSVLPPTFYAAFVLLTISFAVSVQSRQPRDSILLLNLITLIFLIHGTPHFLYGTVRYAWTWKHIGVVEYIQRHGSVDPNLDAYHNWPGFFALSAFFSDAAGLSSALDFAGWAPIFFNLFFVGALLLVFKSLTADRRLVWLGVWSFALANWIGQDYFSPQAFGYFLYLVVIGICLRWFRSPAPPVRSVIKRWLRFERLTFLAHTVLSRADKSASPAPQTHPYQRVGLTLIVVVVLGVIACSHQLTPFIAIFALAGLVIGQVCIARNLPVLMLVLTVTWMLYLAEAFLRGNLYWVVDSIGRLSEVTNPDLINFSTASPDQVVVGAVSRIFTAWVVILALCGVLRRLRAGYWDWTAAILVLSSAMLIVTNSYGGEMLFRAYFFALPFIAFWVGAVVYPSSSSGSSWRTFAMTALLSWTVFAGLLFAYYGKERMNYFTQKEVNAAQYLYEVAPLNSIIMSATWDYPSLFHNYENYSYQSICCGPRRMLPSVQESLVDSIARLMRENPAGYFIINRSQRAHLEMSGLIAQIPIDTIEQSIVRSKQFKRIYANEDAEIYTLANPAEVQR